MRLVPELLNCIATRLAGQSPLAGSNREQEWIQVAQ